MPDVVLHPPVPAVVPPARRPKLSLAERDRRWAALRQLLRDERLDALVVGTFRGREAYDTYITNDHLDAIVVFPMDGEPTVVTWNTTHLSRAVESEARGESNWVADRRPGFGGRRIAELVDEKGLQASRIGLVGQSPTSAGEREGTLPHSFWLNLADGLPRATFVDITVRYTDLLLFKSDEEIRLVRYAAEVSEAACGAMLAACEPGVPEDEVYAAVMAEIFRRGCDVRYPFMSLQSGAANIAWGRPRWAMRAETPRTLADGDMVQAEIHTCYGGQEAQVQMSVGLGAVDEVNRRCADLARRSYEVGLAAIRPGVVFQDVVRAMSKPVEEAGCWAKTPMAHTMNYGAVGGTLANREQLAGTPEALIEACAPLPMRRGDLVLKAGMLLELEPNACVGNRRVVLGGAVLVTAHGCEALNELSTRVHYKRSSR